MTPLTELLLWISRNFTGERYLLYTKIQGIIWSMVDLVLIYCLLKIIDLVYAKSERKRIFIRYILLILSALLVPALVFSKTSRIFFVLESIICGIHFSILIYIAMVERKLLLDYLKNLFVGKC